jgi:putative two-component system response regulator
VIQKQSFVPNDHRRYDILKTIDFPWPIAEIVWQHHERINGSGYPRGLKGVNILPEARIVAVADTVGAMAAHRPYRAGARFGSSAGGAF